MRRKIGSMLAGLLLLAGLAAPAGAQQGFPEVFPESNPFNPLSTEMVNESATAWIVTLMGNAEVDGGSAAKMKQEKDAFKQAAAANGLNLKIRNEFGGLINGLSVTASPAEAKRIARLPGVKAVDPVITFSIPDSQPVISPEMFTALAQTGADVAQSELGFTGKGIKVAVMDTGIDIDHPDFGGGFGPGHRIAYGYDFVGDTYDANSNNPTYNPIPTPDPIPDDCQGHGTHVAGIVGANGTVKGVAPDVTFGAYRVFGCTGSTDADIMIAAMEMAWRDGMDVLNMSIGSAFTWPQYPTAVAASKLVKKGMVVVASIGNEGASGLYSAGAPGLGEEVIGVAAFENTHNFFPVFTVAPDGFAVGYGGATGAPTAPLSGTYDVEVVAPGSTSAGCTTSGGVPGSVAGKIALIQRGTCGFAEKAANAQGAGAVGVILYNNAAGRVNPTVEGATPITIPVVSITQADGLQMIARMSGGQGQMTWTDQKASFLSSLGNTIASFSSYGLAADLTLKPDLGAPGGNIYSTYPLEKGGFATLGGTSMSSPHVAGAVALLLEAKPGTKATEVRSILQNTAEPQLWWGNPGLGFLDNVVRQGAGMIQIDKAILNAVTVTPGKLSLGESEAGPRTFHLQLKNDGDQPVTYTLGAVAGLAVGGNTYAPGFFGPGTAVSFEKQTVTVNGHATANVNVTIADPGYAQGTQFGGWLTLTPDNNGQVLRVPYAGFAGDYQAVQVLTPTPNGFPWLALQQGTSLFKLPDGWTFSMEGDDIAHLLVHLNHQSELLRAEVVDAATGKSLGLAFPDETYLPRNPTAAGFFDFPWDGYLYNPGGKVKQAPEGAYKIVLQVLKANGERNNPAHWESWTSPTITIDRP